MVIKRAPRISTKVIGMKSPMLSSDGDASARTHAGRSLDVQGEPVDSLGRGIGREHDVEVSCNGRPSDDGPKEDTSEREDVSDESATLILELGLRLDVVRSFASEAVEEDEDHEHDDPGVALPVVEDVVTKDCLSIPASEDGMRGKLERAEGRKMELGTYGR
jgi:hypothetical protein